MMQRAEEFYEPYNLPLPARSFMVLEFKTPDVWTPWCTCNSAVNSAETMQNKWVDGCYACFLRLSFINFFIVYRDKHCILITLRYGMTSADKLYPIKAGVPSVTTQPVCHLMHQEK